MGSSNLLKLASISLFLAFLTFSFAASPSHQHLIDDEEQQQVYILDAPLSFPTNSQSRLTTSSRFLASVIKTIKKGARCDALSNNICNGVSANNGTSILHCCKKHCRNVLGDGNNCGQCGHKCRLDQRCCSGICTDVLHNTSHCGKCNKKCSPGVICDNGYCGYA